LSFTRERKMPLKDLKEKRGRMNQEIKKCGVSAFGRW
jgi:hypothetical protein